MQARQHIIGLYNNNNRPTLRLPPYTAPFNLSRRFNMVEKRTQTRYYLLRTLTAAAHLRTTAGEINSLITTANNNYKKFCHLLLLQGVSSQPHQTAGNMVWLYHRMCGRKLAAHGHGLLIFSEKYWT